MVTDCVKRLDEIYEDNKGFETVLFSELELGFEVEDDASVVLILKTVTLGFHAIIANVGIHTINYDVGQGFICAIEKIDRVLVVCIGGNSFFEYG